MTCDKFFGDRLRGVDSVGGRKLPFPIDKASHKNGATAQPAIKRAIRDGKLRPRYRHLTVDETCVVFDSDPFTPLWENMTSSTKPEVHKRTLLLSEQEWVTDNLVKFGREVSEISEQTDRQTYRHVDHYTSHPYWGCSNNSTRCSRRQQTSSTVQPPSELDKTCTSYLILAHSLHYVKTWRHPQNWKYHYVTYCTLLYCRGKWSHGHRQHVQWHLDVWFLKYASGQTNRHYY